MSLQETLERVRSSLDPQNEESAKIQVIAPILQGLGWNPFNGEEVLFEHSVGGKKGGRVDIALKSKGRIVALIEAKAPQTDLNTHVEQVLGYAFHEGVDICALTTGLEWWLYLPREKGEPHKRRFAIMDVKQDPMERLAEDFEQFLGKKCLSGGRSHRQAQKVLKASLEADQLKTEIPKLWDRVLKEPDEELVELIAKRVYDKVSIRPSREQVIAVLNNLPVPVSTPLDDSTAVATTAESSAGEAGSQSGTRMARPARKPIAIELWGQRHEVNTHKEVLHKVADALYRRHADDFEELLELKGRKHPYVALSPHALMNPKSCYEVASSGYFIDTHLSALDVRRRADLLLRQFGYPPSDLEVLFG